MKNSNDTIGNRNRDLPACSAMPQPTAPPGAPHFYVQFQKQTLIFYLQTTRHGADDTVTALCHVMPSVLHCSVRL
jgi:hypothetical protein